MINRIKSALKDQGDGFKKFSLGFIFLLLFILIFLYFFLINTTTPFLSDDYNFISNIHGFQNILSYAWDNSEELYLIWSGRLSVHLAEYIFFSFPALLKFLNSLIFCAFIYGIFLNIKLRQLKEKDDFFTLIIILFTVWFFMREFAETVIWKTGAVAYLWPLAGTLLFIYPFNRLFITVTGSNNSTLDYFSEQKSSYTQFILLTLGAMILSTSHEVLAITISSYLLCLTLLCYFRTRKIPRWVITPSLFYWAGTIIIIIAPGNHHRAIDMAGGNVEASGLHFFIIKTLKLTKLILAHFSIRSEALPLALLVLAALSLFLLEKKSRLLKITVTLLVLFSAISMFQSSYILHLLNAPLFIMLTVLLILFSYKDSMVNTKVSILFLSLSFLSAFAMIGAPGVWFGDRTAFFADTFFLMAILVILTHPYSFKYWQATYRWIGIGCIILLIPSMTNAYLDIANLSYQANHRDYLLSLYKKNNTSLILLSPLAKRQNTLLDNAVLVYQPHLIVLDFQATLIQKFFSGGHVEFRPFVEQWDDLKMATQHLDTKPFATLVKNHTLYYIANQPCTRLANKDPFFLYVSNSFPKVLNIFSGNNYSTFSHFPWSNEHLVTVVTAQGKVKDDVCVLAVELPNCCIKQIATGQYQMINHKMVYNWKKQLSFPP